MTADTIQSKVIICALAKEVRHNGSDIDLAENSPRRWNLANVVAGSQAGLRVLHKPVGQVRKVGRVRSIKGHE